MTDLRLWWLHRCLNQGKYRSTSGIILPDNINILFTDTPFDWNRDRLLIERYAEGIKAVVQKVLNSEEAILVAVYPICHVG